MANTDLYELAKQTRAQGRELRAEGYAGKTRFAVYNDGFSPVTVFAASMQDAIWVAARHWKVDPRKAAFHQACRVRKC